MLELYWLILWLSHFHTVSWSPSSLLELIRHSANPGNFSTAKTTTEPPGSACAWVTKPAVGKNRNAENFPQWGHSTWDCRCCWNTHCLLATFKFYLKKTQVILISANKHFHQGNIAKTKAFFFLLVSRKFKSALKTKYSSCTKLVLQKQQLSTPKLAAFSERFT